MGENTTPMNTHLAIQQQALQRQQIELESAIEELDTNEAWKVIGNIMVKKDPQVLKKELQEKLATVTNRLERLQNASN